MNSLTKALRVEMRAAARGESKQAVEALRAELHAIRKSIAMLERRLLTGAAGSRGAAASAAAAGKGLDGRRARFSPALMRKHRDSVGLSRKAYARLLGVSSLSIYLWEAGRTKPRRQTVLLWQDLRKKGARALRALAGVPAPRRRAAEAKRKPRAAAKKKARRAAKGRKPLAAKKRARRVARKRMGRAKAA